MTASAFAAAVGNPECFDNAHQLEGGALVLVLEPRQAQREQLRLHNLLEHVRHLLLRELVAGDGLALELGPGERVLAGARKKERARVRWRLTVENARTKLGRAYPQAQAALAAAA